LSTLPEVCVSKYLYSSCISFFPAAALKPVCILAANILVAMLCIYVNANPSTTRTPTYIQNCLSMHSPRFPANMASIASDILLLPSSSTLAARYEHASSSTNQPEFFINSSLNIVFFVPLFIMLIFIFPHCLLFALLSALSAEFLIVYIYMYFMN